MSRSPRRRRAKPSSEGLAYASERSSGNETRPRMNRTGKDGTLQFLIHSAMPIILISQGHLRIELPTESAFFLVAGLTAATASAFRLKRIRRS